MRSSSGFGAAFSAVLQRRVHGELLLAVEPDQRLGEVLAAVLGVARQRFCDLGGLALE